MKAWIVAAFATVLSIAPEYGSADDLERDANVFAVRPPVTAAQLAPFEANGSGSITGRLIAELPGDRLRAFSEVPVYAVPVIPYTYWFSRQGSLSWLPGHGVADFDAGAPDVKRFFKTQRLAVSDAQGIFKFTNLPAGSWMVYTRLVVRDGRTYTEAHTTTSQDMEYVGNSTNDEGESHMDFAPMPHEETSYSQGHYTCQTSGTVVGTIEVEENRTVSIPLGLIGQSNQGC